MDTLHGHPTWWQQHHTSCVYLFTTRYTVKSSVKICLLKNRISKWAETIFPLFFQGPLPHGEEWPFQKSRCITLHDVIIFSRFCLRVRALCRRRCEWTGPGFGYVFQTNPADKPDQLEDIHDIVEGRSKDKWEKLGPGLNLLPAPAGCVNMWPPVNFRGESST